jgi:hypothetical protein
VKRLAPCTVVLAAVLALALAACGDDNGGGSRFAGGGGGGGGGDDRLYSQVAETCDQDPGLIRTLVRDVIDEADDLFEVRISERELLEEMADVLEENGDGDCFRAATQAMGGIAFDLLPDFEFD